MNPADAAECKLVEGDWARVESRYGHALLRIHISPAVKSGELFTTFHSVEGFVNQITSPRRDHRASTPEYKLTAVRVERIPPQEVPSG